MFVQANQLSKIYSTDWVFRNVTFDLQQGERIALVGPNGCGKTTLLKCITKQESWEEGELFIRKGLTIGYLQQIPIFEPEVTVEQVLHEPFTELMHMERRMKVLETEMSAASRPSASATVFESSSQHLTAILEEYGRCQREFELKGGYEIAARIDKVCQGLNISKRMRASAFMQLSGGEKTKISLALILLQEPELLLLDEPTNHLDLAAIEWLEGFLQTYQGTVLVVSHDRYFLDRVAQKIFDLENGELTIYSGNYSAFLKQKEVRLLNEFQAYQEQQKKIKKMRETIKKLRQWANEANPPNAGLHRRANSMQKALDRMEKVRRPILERRKMNLSFELEQRSGKEVVLIEDAILSLGGKELFAGVHLHARFQEKIAIIGANGAGKSTLLKLILGELQPEQGKVKLGSNVKEGYLSQAGIEGYEHETVLAAYRDQANVEEGEARDALARFLFYGASVFRKVKELSGGEKMRLRFAQLMAQDINVLLLDEPTNHLDIDSREVLEDALEEFTGTVIAVSHDRYFLNKLFSKTYELEYKKLHLYLGSYDEVREQRLKRISDHQSLDKKHRLDQKQHKEPHPHKSQSEKTHQMQGTDSKEAVDPLFLEQQIEELEEQIHFLNTALYLPENQDKLEELQRWSEQKLELEQQRDVLLEEWVKNQ